MMDWLMGNLPKIELVFALWVFIAIAVFVDLLTGVYKAKSLGYLITSDGLKRTVNKLIIYYSLMLFACMLDVVGYGVELFSVPYFSLAFCALVIVIEGKSVWERADEKERKRLVSGAKDVTAILATKEDIAKAVHDKLNKENETTNQ